MQPPGRGFKRCRYKTSPQSFIRLTCRTPTRAISAARNGKSRFLAFMKASQVLGYRLDAAARPRVQAMSLQNVTAVFHPPDLPNSDESDQRREKREKQIPGFHESLASSGLPVRCSRPAAGSSDVVTKRHRSLSS